MLCIVVYTLLGVNKLVSQAQWRSCIQIAVELRKSAGRNLQADAVSCLEDLRCIPAGEMVIIDLTWFDQRGTIHTIAKTSAHHAIAQSLTEAIGPDIDEHSHKICISGR